MEPSPADIGDLYDRHGAMVFRRCRSILGDDQAAMDATQDVFVRVIDKWDTFRGEASAVTWLYRISTNLCLNRRRNRLGRQDTLEGIRQSRESVLDPTLFGGGLPGPGSVERRLLATALLEQVDEETRAVAIYYHIDGMTQDEISALVGRSKPTIRKRLQAFRDAAERLIGKGQGVALLAAALLAASVQILAGGA